ncbi:MAG: glycosyltransferase [Thermofilum sp.]|jgi:glycosyltransferase involved in cell wall biosynthesis|uniref:glycosyltransferase n=1 Tax=Thermofilum sp. TaxID=1961369 RepID=UPI00258B0D92|nr:glycosyltransferase [Thermofilum sp.]MCI4408414.1 glycosyltransferase [Thermofilum sp.]
MTVLGIITKNSYSRLGKTYLDVLDSTLQVPYKTIILVDDGNDETVNVTRKWCCEHGKELVFSRSNLYGYHRPTRATGRQTTIDIFLNNFSDEWLMFVDDDAVLNKGWWQWVEEGKHLEDPAVGELWGINWDSTPERERFLKLFGIDLKSYLIRKFEERGGTHDTLYRRKAIDGIKIPPELHVYEDAYLHFYVKCRGWKYVVNPVGVTHYHPMDTTTNIEEEKKKLKIAIESALKYGICEYETLRAIKTVSGNKNKILGYLSLFRPLLGFAPMLPVAIRTYGIKRGVPEAFKRQYLKLWFRWQVLKNIDKLDIDPDPCKYIGKPA